MLELRPYQLDTLDRSAAALERGVRRQLWVHATGLGKALATSELVLTPTGWRAMGDLRVGDEVVGADGKPTAVLGVFPQGNRPAFDVSFTDGPVVRCDADHLWNVRTKHGKYQGRPWRTHTTAELLAKGITDPQGGRRWEVPIAAPVEHEHADLPLDPYLLGILLGDGGLSVHGRVLVHTEDDLVATIELPAPARWKRLADCGAAGTWIIGGPTGRAPNPVLSAVRALGLEGSLATDKAVPPAYMIASPQQRLDLLRGLMDADGHVRPKDGHVEVTFANYQLAQDVANLVRSLAGTAAIHPKATTWTHREVKHHGHAWRVSIAMPTCPFRWARKADVWRPRTKYQPRRAIAKIEPRGTDDMVCIKVAADDGLFLTRGYVVTHNTVMFAELIARRGGRALVLVHRDELAWQAVVKLLESRDYRVTKAAQAALVAAERADLLDRALVATGPLVGIVKADADDVAADVLVASVQTLARPARLAALADPPESLLTLAPLVTVVVDEAHHTPSPSYRSILRGLHAGQPDGPLLVGVTATPDRGDGHGLDRDYDEVVATYDTLWGITNGYLCDVRAIEVKLAGFNEGDLKKSGGDYTAGSAGAALTAAHAPELIAQAWERYAEGRPTVVFTPTVVVAHAVAAAFGAIGVAGAAISGETPQVERRSVLRQLRSGELLVVANCAVLTEGWDEPIVSCVAMARPTTSRGLYSQMAGRGLRVHPAKQDCIAEGQRVLTDMGLVPIEQVTTAMKVWDGEQYVTHYGAVCRGYQEVITYAGLTATADHKVWTDDGWLPFARCAAEGRSIAVTGAGRRPIREARGHRRDREDREGATAPGSALRDVWDRGLARKGRSAGIQGRLSGLWQPTPGAEVAYSSVHRGEVPMHQPSRPRMGSLWRPGHQVRVPDPARYGALGSGESWAAPRAADRPDRQRRPLPAGQSALLDRRAEPGSHPKAAPQPSRSRVQVDPPRGSVCGLDPELPRRSGPNTRADCGQVPHAFGQTQRRVWDLLNAGPLHRFTVEGLLVSNCLILDIVGNTDRHNLVTVPSLFGVNGDVRARTGAAKLSAIIRDQADAMVARGLLSAAEATLFKNMPESNIVWLPGVNPKSGLEQWMRPLGRTKVGRTEYKELPTVVLIRRHPTADEWVTGLVFANGTKRVLIDRVTLATAQGVGEDYVRKNAASIAFVAADAGWRQGPPTPKQLAAAALFHVEPDPSWSAGQLADAIDNAKAQRRGLTTQGAPTHA